MSSDEIEINKEEMRIGEKYVSFWGSPLSNFFPCKIQWKGHTFKSSEQLFMYNKAVCFGDCEIREQILSSETPKEAKKLGRKIKGFDEKVWEDNREMAMYIAVSQKFMQNPKLGEFLFSKEFEGKHFVEGSPYDKVWGVGLLFSDERIDNEEEWGGLNLLGKILDEVKENLK